jgi:DNA-binding GntR family transcriptional regulator
MALYFLDLVLPPAALLPGAPELRYQIQDMSNKASANGSRFPRTGAPPADTAPGERRNRAMAGKIARPKSLTELVVDELRKRIIDGRLRLGEALSENALAAELGLSKTPVREALLQLKLERLVDVLPQRGTYVFQLAIDQVAMISELREILEVSAVAAAVERNHTALVSEMAKIFEAMRGAFEAGDNTGYRTLDGEYHQTIIDLCGNPYISDAYVQVSFRTQALRSRLSVDASLNKLSFRDHREMLKLIRARDVSALQKLLRAHIKQTKQMYLDVLERQELLTKAG